jgi:hypothetical protein
MASSAARGFLLALLVVLLVLLLQPLAANAKQTTVCDTTERERAVIVKRALEALGDEYDVIEGKLSFPPFAQPGTCV